MKWAYSGPNHTLLGEKHMGTWTSTAASLLSYHTWAITFFLGYSPVPSKSNSHWINNRALIIIFFTITPLLHKPWQNQQPVLTAFTAYPAHHQESSTTQHTSPHLSRIIALDILECIPCSCLITASYPRTQTCPIFRFRLRIFGTQSQSSQKHDPCSWPTICTGRSLPGVPICCSDLNCRTVDSPSLAPIWKCVPLVLLNEGCGCCGSCRKDYLQLRIQCGPVMDHGRRSTTHCPLFPPNF